MISSRPSVTDSVTELIARLREGRLRAGAPGGHEKAEAMKAEVLGELFERAYPELRQGARGQRRRWAGDPSLRTTALAHEAYLKLAGQGKSSWKSRSHFFAVAAQAMRYLLINGARRSRAQKRGGGAPTLSLEELREVLGREGAVAEERAEVLILLDEALALLETEHPRAARGVECRFFGGMTIEETAEALGISAATVSRDWTLAQAWLYRAVKQILSTDGILSADGPNEGDNA